MGTGQERVLGTDLITTAVCSPDFIGWAVAAACLADSEAGGREAEPKLAVVNEVTCAEACTRSVQHDEAEQQNTVRG